MAEERNETRRQQASTPPTKPSLEKLEMRVTELEDKLSRIAVPDVPGAFTLTPPAVTISPMLCTQGMLCMLCVQCMLCMLCGQCMLCAQCTVVGGGGFATLGHDPAP